MTAPTEPARPLTRAEKLKRSEGMAAMCRKGATQLAIAVHFGVSEAAVYRVLIHRGLITPARQYRARAGEAQVIDIHPGQIVDRDPCPRCAVRADIGCVHRPKDQGPPPWARPVGVADQKDGVPA